MRRKAAGFASAAALATDDVAFNELVSLAILYESRAAEIQVALPGETPESLRFVAAEVLLLAEKSLRLGWPEALREIAAVYLAAAAERETRATAP